MMFFVTIFVVFAIYNFFDYTIKEDNYVDIFASGIFFTAMWYMANKKIENWTLWIFGDILVVPLYAYRGLGMLSLQYLIFTILAISAYLEWRKILNNSTQLADYFDTVWAPEFARDYLEKKLNTTAQTCSPEDLLPIAIGQVRQENEALLTANKYLFCDTCLLVTKVFSEINYNFCDSILDKAARKHKYDLFFLTDVDVPWENDGLRDQPDNREAHFTIFKESLLQNNKPFIVLSGNAETRFEQAKKIIKELEKAKEMGFSSHDFVQIYERGISLETINSF